MPRYVVLLHKMPPTAVRATHWDFMLEDANTLMTWALNGELDEGPALEAERLADHRNDYLDYEGPVSGDRGSVIRWDAGTFEWIDRCDDELVVELNGERLRGIAVLKRIGEADNHRWSVSLRKI